MVKMTGQVLRLKTIAQLYGLSTRQIAEGITTPVHRNYISNAWNLGHGVSLEKQRQIIEFLKKQGAPEALADSAFIRVNETEDLLAVQKLAASASKQAENPDQIIETKGVIMLRTPMMKHFGLSWDPFQPRRQDKPYMSRAFLAARELIEDAMSVRAFLAISGPTGCGKSVLWTFMRQCLADESLVKVVTVRRFDKDRIRTSDIYLSILEDLAGEGDTAKKGNERAHRRVEKLLIANANEGINTVILINEAHDLDAGGLKMLKRLWEIFNDAPELGYQRACTIVMLGQEQLRATLRQNRPELIEVVQRVDLENYGLLTSDEIEKYLAHRLNGGATLGRIFEPGAIEFFATRKIKLTPLSINVMATQSMQVAWQVGAEKVTAEHAGYLLH